ncbi:cytochrome p450 [Fusarium longipes]|uniref:Cytochrome p450 n=1 Tax=Fusarium longipes TaxID=694270 RepID=A0A395T2J7_9HYPO|nr:cytochrome p450 [Fusarium longipes]
MALLSLLENGLKASPLVFLPASAFVLVTTYLLCNYVYNLFFHPLREFPGPKLWAISNIPYSRMFLSGKCHFKIRQLHQKYGPIVRIGPNDLSVNHPDAMKDLRGHRKTGRENPKDRVVTDFNNDNIIGAGRQGHQRYRRAVAHGFSNQSMIEQEPIIAGYVDQFIQALHEICENGTKPVDMAAWFNFTTFDIIGDLAFGEPFGCLASKKLHPWISIIFEGVENLVFLSCLSRYPWLYNLAMFLMPKSSTKKLEEHREVSRGKVRKRLALKEERPDFINAMIKRTGASGQEMSFEELASNAGILILAGSETTATLLTAVTYYLTTNPRTLEKLSNEVRSSFKSESEINMASVQRLSYMLAVLNEGLRLFPPVINGAQRKIREEGDMIIDHYIPGGVCVDIWHWAVYHNPDHFLYPDDFIPERWLDDPRFANDVKRAMQPFSVGPRDCVGKKWAHRIHALANERQVNSRRDCAIEDLIDPEDYDEDISDYCSSSDESCVTDKGCVFDDCEMCIKHDYEPEYHNYSIDFTETGLYFELFQDQREERKKEIRDKKEQRKRWIEKKERLTKKDIKLESRRWKWVEAALQKMIAKEARKEKLPALGDLRKRRFTLVSPDHIKACPWDFASERFIEFCSEYLVDDISEDDSDYDPDEYDEYGRQRRQGERISGSVHMLGDTICRLEPFVPPKHARQLTTYLQSQDRKWQMHLFSPMIISCC